MPALRLALYGQGIEFWCAPTARAGGPVKQARRQSGGRESEGSPISWQLLPG